MKIQIDDISSTGTSVALDDGSGDVRAVLKALDLEHAGTTVRFEARLVRLGDLVDVSGRISGHTHLPCSRCLEPVAFSIDETFRFFLRPPLREAEIPEGAEIELSEDELEYGFLEGGVIDVESLVQEQLALLLPSQILCRPDCRGICQGCGAALNHESCRCEKTAGDERWAKLRLLRRT